MLGTAEYSAQKVSVMRHRSVKAALVRDRPPRMWRLACRADLRQNPAPYAGPGPGEVQGFLLAWKGISACPKSDFRYLCSYLPSRLPHLAVPVGGHPETGHA